MIDETLFSKFSLDGTIRNHREKVREEIDNISDTRLLATDIDELISYVEDKWGLDFPELGEGEISTERTKIEVGRYGGRGHGFSADEGVMVDAEKFTLEVPFTGDADLFHHRGNRYSSMVPRGSIYNNVLSHTITLREPDIAKLNTDFARFLKDVNEYLSWLVGDVQNFNSSIPDLVKGLVSTRRNRAQKAESMASGLNFKIRARDQASSLVMPVQRKKLNPTLPRPRLETKSEPSLSMAKYEEILSVLRDMSTVLERSPGAFANMDEEALRFQFLVPLNGQFEADARGEVFNSKGKTDILISEKGKNIFIAECKIWRGEDSLTKTIDQILGYLSWRDTKAAIILFNRNKNFSQVLTKITDVVERHSNYKATSIANEETEFRFLFKHRDDADREISLAILAFDVPL